MTGVRNANEPDRAAILMYAILLATYVVNAMDRQVFPIFASDVRKELSLSLAQVGLAASVFTLGMGVSGIPIGFVLTRVRRKQAALLGIAIFSLATWLTAYSRDLPTLLACRFLSGLGEALQLGAVLAIGTSYFVRHRALAVSALNFAFGFGALAGPVLGTALLVGNAWRIPFLVFGAAGIPAVLMILLFVKPWFSEARSIAPQAAKDFAILQTPQSPVAFSLLSVATALAGLTIYGYLALYPTFLREAVGFSPGRASWAVGAFGFGALTSLFGGWLGDRWDPRLILTVSLTAASFLGAYLFTPLGGSWADHIVCSFLFGVAASGISYSNLSIAITKSLGVERAPLAAGVFISCLYLPAAFAGYTLGMLKQALGWGVAASVQLGGCGLLAAVLCLLAKVVSSRPGMDDVLQH